MRQLLSHITSMTMDRLTSTGTIVTTDGDSISFPLQFEPDPDGAIRRLTYAGRSNQLILETYRGDSIPVEIPLPRDAGLFPSCPVVYLDQKDWSLLANVCFEPERVSSSEERAAAEQLISLAQEEKIVLPMSLGHMGETAKWTNEERRYRLGLTVARLSRGWQMRHPLDIRASEIRRSFANRLGHDAPTDHVVFTLDPCAAEATSTSSQYLASHAELGQAIGYLAESLTCISAYFEAILHSEAVPMGSVSGWVESNQEYTRWLEGTAWSSAKKRKSIWGRLLGDLGSEITQVAYKSGISPEDLDIWLAYPIAEEAQSLPSLSIFCEMYQDKHLNSKTIWNSNDLIDMMYLSCAAAYADFVIGERSLVSYARQAARRLDRKMSLHSRMTDLVKELEASVV